MDIIQAVEDLNRTKRWKKGEFTLLELRPPASPALRQQHSWFSGLWTWSRPDTICCPGYQAFRFVLELYYWLSWASSYRWQMVECLSLHNHVNQPLIINLFICAYPIIYIYIYFRRTLTNTGGKHKSSNSMEYRGSVWSWCFSKSFSNHPYFKPRSSPPCPILPHITITWTLEDVVE